MRYGREVFLAGFALLFGPVFNHTLTVTTPQLCKDEEYFDGSRLVCRKCGDGTQQSSDGLSCECKFGHRKTIPPNGTRVLCDPCTSTQVVSKDGWNCVECSPANPFDNVTGTCAVCQNGIEGERLLVGDILQKYCIPCEESNWPDSTGTRCTRCPQDFLASSNGKKCLCANKFTLTGGTCIPTNRLLPPESSLFTLSYQTGKKVKSAYLYEHLQAAVYNCKVLENSTACQILGNMCVLLLYHTDSSPLEPCACSEYLKLTAATPETGHGPRQWPPHAPWLFYLETETALELGKTNVPNQFSMNRDSPGLWLNLTLVGYSLSGHYLGMRTLASALAESWKTSVADMEESFVFGVNFQRTFQLQAKELWSPSNVTFYDIYLANIGRQDGQQALYPVPVLVRDLDKNGHRINAGSDRSQWQFVRRFFLVDTVSGIESPGPGTGTRGVLRYAETVSVRITVLDDGGGKIYPPLLIIKYAELTEEDYRNDITVKITLSVIYKMDQSKTFQNISIALGVLSSLCVLWTCFSTWGWAKRAGKRTVDVLTLCRFLIFLCGSLANAFLLVLLLSSLNWIVVYKKQDIVHLLLPTVQQESGLIVCVSVAFVMKSLHLLILVVDQCTCNLFFIDWERPQGRRGSAARRNSSKVVVDSAAAGVGKDFSESNHRTVGVSIWRMYYVANEWADLQTVRRVQPSHHLFLVLLFLKVAGFETLALSDPYSNFTPNEQQRWTPINSTARFALDATIFLCLAFIQMAMHKLIYERFVRDRLQQFVDLCSVSNISVFIMSAARYGHYIHGRSAHGRADVGMKEMHGLLRKEEDDLCGQRGLLPNTEQQTFIMSLPAGVQEQYSRLLLPLTSYSQSAGRMQGVGSRLSKVDIDRVDSAYQMVNKFLSGFIEHAYKDLDYIVRDRLFLENILDLEFSDVHEKGNFYNDHGRSFDAVLFCGQEMTLLTFELLLFAVVDLTTHNVVLAAVLTYFVSKVIEWLRRSAGRRNLVRKALVDERFLN